MKIISSDQQQINLEYNKDQRSIISVSFHVLTCEITAKYCLQFREMFPRSYNFMFIFNFQKNFKNTSEHWFHPQCNVYHNAPPKCTCYWNRSYPVLSGKAISASGAFAFSPQELGCFAVYSNDGSSHLKQTLHRLEQTFLHFMSS